MKKIFSLGFLFLFLGTAYAQIISEEFSSRKLGEKRKLVIYLPEKYSDKEAYPLLVVLNAGSLMEPVLANARYYEYFENMPKCIIVGVYNTLEDVKTGKNGELTRQSANFLDFMGGELIPYIHGKYSVNNFKGIIAKDEGAYVSNYFFLGKEPLFNVVISLNPKTLPAISETISDKLNAVKRTVFYYIATTNYDHETAYTNTKSLNSQIVNNLTTEDVKLFFDDFPKTSLHSVALSGIPRAFDLIFSSYKPIDAKEFKENLQPLSEDIFYYLEDKYKKIESELGFKKTPVLNDIMATYDVIIEKEDWDSLIKLSDYVKDNGYEKTAMPNFFLGEYYEHTGDNKRALRAYQKAYTELPIDFIKKDIIDQRIVKLRK